MYMGLLGLVSYNAYISLWISKYRYALLEMKKKIYENISSWGGWGRRKWGRVNTLRSNNQSSRIYNFSFQILSMI